MPDFKWIFDKLIGEETPLALGFAGMMMAGGLFALIHAILSQMGVIGSGKIEKRNTELEAERMRLMSENAALAVEKARLEERCVGQEATMAEMRRNYEEDLAAEKERSKTLISRINEIAELEQKIKPQRKPRARS